MRPSPLRTGLLGLALVAVAGCAAPATESPAPAAAPAPTTRTVTTDRGPVEVPADPQRVVVLSGGLAGYLYALEAEVVATDTRVLGVTDLDGGFPQEFGGRPPAPVGAAPGAAGARRPRAHPRHRR